MQRLEKYSLKTFKYAEKTPLPKMCSLGLKLLRDPKRRGTPNEDFPLKLSRSLVCEKKKGKGSSFKSKQSFACPRQTYKASSRIFGHKKVNIFCYCTIAGAAK